MGEWIQAYNQFRRELQLVAAYIVASFKQELIAQGHKNTGKLNESFEIEIKDAAEEIILEIYSEHYGQALETGTASTRTPFNGNRIPKTGTGAKSEYISELRKWVESRFGLQGYESLKATFAIAHTQKKEGMPTRNSFSKSPNGERKNWITRTINRETSEIDHLVDTAADNYINAIFTQILDNTAQRIR